MTTLMTPFRAFDSLVNTALPSTGKGQHLLRPRVDIFENDNEYRLTADLPGVKREDLSVEVEKGNLVLTATRKESNQDLSPLRVERFADVKFTRTFSLGDDVDVDKISAALEDGVLSVAIPKQEKSLPRRIEVR